MDEKDIADGITELADVAGDGKVIPFPAHFPPRPLRYDLNFEDRPEGFEIWFSDRIAIGHRGLVEEFADWFEGLPNIENVGQLDYQAIFADGILGDELKGELTAWWTTRVERLKVG
jgi:hypothetical protein